MSKADINIAGIENYKQKHPIILCLVYCIHNNLRFKLKKSVYNHILRISTIHN